ncbi:MAG: S9 family peptidase [Pseudoxanthomonas sp.]|nr:S9 family peptidase [Pseudoxanthomonas sp.]
MKAILAALLPFLSAAGAPLASASDLETLLKRPTFIDMKIAPDGRHLAATVPQGDDRTVLVVLERGTMRPTSVLQMRGKEHIDQFHWVSDSRLVVSVAIRDGMLDQPQATGELYGVNADGSAATPLFGFRLAQGIPAGGSNIRRPQAEQASAFLIDTLPGDERQVLVNVVPWAGEEAHSEVRRLNVATGRTSRVVRSPVPRADFLTDLDGNVRLAVSVRGNGDQQLHHRAASGGEWRLIHDQGTAGGRALPLYFESADVVVVRQEREQGTDSLMRWNLASGEKTLLLQPEVADAQDVLYGIAPRSVYAVRSHPDRPRLLMLDPEAREARLANALAEAFPGQHAWVTSFTRDGKLGLVHVYSDRNPGEFYLFDLETLRATYLGTTREWIDPDRMAEMRPITLAARDGTVLHGYLVLPPGREPRGLPMVVNPHGGPHGVRDTWGFDEEAQLLASRGYAVLKVNFRGSGGYGGAFERAGYRQWGGLMQDDIADATRWAVREGIADGERVCVYGASYGGYSAMMQAARHGELYRCAIGYVGVYDLALMYQEGDVRRTMFGRSYLERILGRSNLSAMSPVNLADRIGVPVMLVHGAEDQRAPQTHADRMRAALRAAGNDPEWLVERREGHGFYTQANRIRLYTQLLAFLDRHIGEGRQAAAGDG